MLRGYEKIRVPDEAKQKDFFFEVNWEKNPKTDNCQVVRVTFPNGEIAHVKRDHLHAIFFALGTPEQQQKLIPQTMQRVRQLEGLFKVKATRPIAKGEDVVFPYKISIPEPEEIVYQDIKKKLSGG